MAAAIANRSTTLATSSASLHVAAAAAVDDDDDDDETFLTTSDWVRQKKKTKQTRRNVRFRCERTVDRVSAASSGWRSNAIPAPKTKFTAKFTR